MSKGFLFPACHIVNINLDKTRAGRLKEKPKNTEALENRTVISRASKQHLICYNTGKK